MSWQVRHEGSPNATVGLTPHQVLEGLHEGVWEPTDEVRGPGEVRWTKMEAHPVFEEAVADYEAPKRAVQDDSHLDMNPLIDVALVLLIFFILTTSYEALRQVMDMPTMTQKNKKNQLQVVDPNQLSEMIVVKGRMDGNKTVITVDGQQVEMDQLKTAIGIGRAQKKTKMVIDVRDVNWDTVIQIIDAGRQQGVQKFMMPVQKEQ
ncbi:MAG: ExbD/TolR family protein [Gemmataceae bacterium]